MKSTIQGVKVYIYALLNEDDEIIYIGKSSTPSDRFSSHKNNGHASVNKMRILDYFYDKEYYYIKKYISEGHNLSNKQTDPWEEDWNIDDIIEYKPTNLENPKKISCKNPLTNKYYDTIEEASVDLGISRHKVKRLLVDTKYILRQKYPLEMVRN
jgi:hypothetical protein